MTRPPWPLLWALSLAVLLLAGCGRDDGAASRDAASGRILLWHAWDEAEAAALAEAIARFEETQPNATVMVQSFPSEEALLREYQQASEAGLGPDVLIGPSSWVRPLADSDLIANLDGLVSDQQLERYMPAAVTSLIYEESLYALPESLDTMALFYNRDLVEAPAQTLDELMQQAAAGNVTVMGTRFQDAFWGIQAFGGQLFDEEGRVILDQGGFANWLAWLKDAREAPGMILDANRDALYDRFASGQAAYYVGRSSELNALTEALGEDRLGVAPLPSGPTGPAGPLLDLQAIYFNPVSSQGQADLALALAAFLTNAEQSNALMRATKQVPANAQVRINPRLDPIVNSLAIQARTAVPAPSSAHLDTVWTVMADIYPKALEGVLDPAEAAIQATEAINTAMGVPPRVATPLACSLQGELHVAVVGDDDLARFFQAEADDFAARCPHVQLTLTPLLVAEMQNMIAADAPALRTFHLILAPQTLLVPLADGGYIRLLDGAVAPELLQRFRPITVNGMRYAGVLYGLPAAMNTAILYYDRNGVDTPARTLTDLTTQAQQNIPVVLSTDAIFAFWGIGGFGGDLANDGLDTDKFENGFAGWLAWLREAGSQANLTLESDHEGTRLQFLEGESVYYVGDSLALSALNARMGTDRLGVALLPNGPLGVAQPLVTTSGFMLGAVGDEDVTALALAFIDQMTDAQSQQALWTETRRLPANAGIETGDDATLSLFLTQASSGVALPNRTDLDAIFVEMNAAYAAVLEEGVEPADAASAFTAWLTPATAADDDAPASDEPADAADGDADRGEPNAEDPAGSQDGDQTSGQYLLGSTC